MTTSRIQLRRTKGWCLPEGAVNCARPGKWGNPLRVVPHAGGYRVLTPTRSFLVYECQSKLDAHRAAVGLFHDALHGNDLRISVADVRRELAGKQLACWCKPTEPCHCDVYLEILRCPKID